MTFTSEVVGVYFVLNSTPDIEGIIFLDEAGDEYRIGRDEPRPATVNFTYLPSRLIGMTARFAMTDSITPIQIGAFSCPTSNIVELGLVVDSTSCEDAIFSQLPLPLVNPFVDMTANVGTGAKVSQL